MAYFAFMAYFAAGFVGYLFGCATMVVVFVLDRQREDRHWLCRQPTEKEVKE